ncbi:squalene/phytoene synthase family protein [Roseomonas sp. GC11]|uniref:squalene/phytoene synthase family protein n=1 Tax=Roseomonas sp. GC11 TaxID=2950546 RepID=UPI00210D18FE|nr:squalene/phytoene synthase family protein [Roseomonas sp. GC11]MCQ4162299.1 squalene/phytoene synthase family protein [Roseomonas sp. GC11]
MSDVPANPRLGEPRLEEARLEKPRLEETRPEEPDPAACILAGPPSRGPDSENFPVASWLIAPALRRRVLAFYHFVRAADDIADAPHLAPGERLARLDALAAALEDPRTPLPVARALQEAGDGLAEARIMLDAFRQDAELSRLPDWAALLDYCGRSAVPVGRLLLRLHGEVDATAQEGADALCTALQILNHLQDMGEDLRRLDRLYVPRDWMALAGGEARFLADPEARAPVLAAMLDRVEEMLDRAAALPHRVLSTRLGLEAAVTWALARRLLARLRAADPLEGRVALGRADFAAALLAAPGLRRGGRPGSGSPGSGSPGSGSLDARLVRARVRRARSSFASGMAATRGPARRAMYAVYAFCRAVDDIADGTLPEAEQRAALAAWRRKLEVPDCPLSRELAWARAEFTLPLAECRAMIDGMEADAGPHRRIATQAELDLYCRQVAGSVGALAVRIFGAAEAEPFGLALGHAFQLVNVLRDIDEDAARDRLYLPADALAAAGIPPGGARAMVAHPGLSTVAQALALRARAAFATAEALMPEHHRRALRPARLMLLGYRALLEEMIGQGFLPPRQRPRLGRWRKLGLLLEGWRP